MAIIETVGAEWIRAQAEALTDTIDHITPVEYNEETRYLPESVTSMPGPIDFRVNPFMREILDCFDVNSPVREVSFMKGVQLTYTTVLESILLYFMGSVKTLPIMFITADKELAAARIENNIIPMLNQSDMAHIIQSSDEGNSRKTGKTKDHIQFIGGGYLVPFGAKNADKMRSFSICVMLKDEIDAWPDKVGKDGDPETLTDDRCSAYYSRRKIFRGSTPLEEHTSKIAKAFKNGDQRYYFVPCKHCGFMQRLRWETTNDDGMVGGILWDLDDNGVLITESVRYACSKCGGEHFEHDKESMFDPVNGAGWQPTAQPIEKNIRSYHLSALYSPIGMQPWYKSVLLYLQAWDVSENKPRDIGKYQIFYNNVLGETFRVPGSNVYFKQVSSHRRSIYHDGEIPNLYAKKWSGSEILMLTCQADIHKDFISVAVMGWTADNCTYDIMYKKLTVKPDEDYDCTSIDCSVWESLRYIIEEKKFVADNGREYNIAITLVDSGYSQDTVLRFCAQWPGGGVYPIRGAQRAPKNQRINEFGEFTSKLGTTGYTITVDHYKDRIAPVLRRSWFEDSGAQGEYHFNAPVDRSDKALEELTHERRVEKKDDKGGISYEWQRMGGRNEFWDLLVYGHAAIEIFAYNVGIQYFELEVIDMPRFWNFWAEQNGFEI